MMLVVSCPDHSRVQRLWISAVLLGDFLGVKHEIRFDGQHTVRISGLGKTLELPDTFFANARGKWLSAESLPAQPLRQWTVAESGLEPKLVTPAVPILFGAAGFRLHGMGDAKLSLDIFGSAFFMLSRYEEAVSSQRDRHGRFPAAASLAYRAGFLGRPVVDEYVEILWAAMLRLWPQLSRKRRQCKTTVSCDVDHPYHASALSVLRLLKRTAGEAMRKRTVSEVVAPVKNYFASRRGDWRNDPYYYTVDWMMDVNERAGNTVAFYFIPEITDPAMDGCHSIRDPAVRAMMRRIADRGHEIGIHPGYRSYQSDEMLASGRNTLQRVIDQERIQQKVMGGRQHYLRWSTHTPAAWDRAGLEYDSTLGYADHVGFRCGTCHEYAMFDLHHGKALEVRQRPLICMESSVATYMGLGWSETALATMKELKKITHAFNGIFTLLWHNTSFEVKAAKELYCNIIAP